QGVAALEGRGRIVDDPEVVGPAVVLEDVVAVEVVHVLASLAERSALIPSDFVGIDARRERPTRQSMRGQRLEWVATGRTNNPIRSPLPTRLFRLDTSSPPWP